MYSTPKEYEEITDSNDKCPPRIILQKYTQRMERDTRLKGKMSSSYYITKIHSKNLKRYQIEKKMSSWYYITKIHPKNMKGYQIEKNVVFV
jgi:hypothetical protein